MARDIAKTSGKPAFPLMISEYGRNNNIDKVIADTEGFGETQMERLNCVETILRVPPQEFREIRKWKTCVSFGEIVRGGR